MDFKCVSFKEFMDSLNNPDLSKPSPVIFFVYNSRGFQLVKVFSLWEFMHIRDTSPSSYITALSHSTFLYPARRLQEKACEF